MARYVVLYFEDNDLAEGYVRGDANIEPLPYGAFEVTALVPAPTLFCDGTPAEKHRGIKKDGFFRGKKYGWWVCTRCGKPKEAWGRRYSAVLSSGINLLQEATHAERAEPEPPRGWDQ